MESASELESLHKILSESLRTTEAPQAQASAEEDPLEGDALSRRRSEYPSAYSSIAFTEGSRVLTITWLPPAG